MFFLLPLPFSLALSGSVTVGSDRAVLSGIMQIVTSAVRDFCTCCEGDGDVVGVVAPLREVAQVVLHGIQVVEVSVRLRVRQDGEVEEDGEGQVEVEREEGEVKEKRSWMACRWDKDSRTP